MLVLTMILNKVTTRKRIKTYSISDTLNLSIFIKGMFVKTAFNVNLMYTRNVDDVEGQDCTRGFWQDQINIQSELYNKTVR